MDEKTEKRSRDRCFLLGAQLRSGDEGALKLVLDAYHKHGGNEVKAAAELDIPRRTIHNWRKRSPQLEAGIAGIRGGTEAKQKAKELGLREGVQEKGKDYARILGLFRKYKGKDKRVAKHLGVTMSLLHLWMEEIPHFGEAVEAVKTELLAEQDTEPPPNSATVA